jgi:uncharacterized protein YndB with AHSA1/START domain
MKISFETNINASMETVWSALTDFSSYPEWNPVLTKAEGNAALGSTLKTALKLSGLVLRNVEVQVTGFTAPKYFSFENHHRWGRWYLQEEWIFRMKERADGVTFIAEAYVTGLGLRFRRSKVEDAFRRSLLNLALALKERIAGAVSNQQGVEIPAS